MYVTNGSAWTISAGLESGKYLKQTAAADGGFDPARFELGVDLTLNAKELGLVGYWPLDEGSGTVARDATGNGNNSTSANIGWVTSGCPAGGCVTVASTNGTIGIPGNAAFDLHTNFTISNWVRIDAAIPASSWPVSFGDGNSHIGYNFRSTSNGTSWMFEYGTDYPTCSGTIWSQSATLALGTNAWHMLTASYDGANIRTYLDGVLVQTKAFATGMCTWQPLYIANTPAAGGIFSVDDTRFYNRVLTTSEIQAMYNAMK